MASSSVTSELILKIRALVEGFRDIERLGTELEDSVNPDIKEEFASVLSEQIEALRKVVKGLDGDTQGLEQELAQLAGKFEDTGKAAKGANLKNAIPDEELIAAADKVDRALDTLTKSGKDLGQGIKTGADDAKGSLSGLEVAGSKTTKSVGSSADSAAKSLKNLGKEAKGVGDSAKQGGKEAETSFKKVKSSATELEDAIAKLKGSYRDLATAGGIGLAVREAISFESAMTDVKKVLDGTPEEFEALGNRLQELSTELPISANGLAEMAAAGGRLGIARKDIEGFIELAAKIGTAFDISANDAGNAVAKLKNVFQLTIPEVEGVGDAINALGNNTAATEPQILNFLTRVGANSKNFGLAADQAAAFGSTLIGFGQAPEVAARGFNTLLQKIQLIQSGTPDAQAAFRSLGFEFDSFSQKLQVDAKGALEEVLKKLGELEGAARTKALNDLFQGFGDEIGTLVGAFGDYEKAIGVVNDKTLVNGALTAEASKRNETTAASLQKLKNAVTNVAVDLGTALLPAIQSLAEGATDLAGVVSTLTSEFPALTTAITGLVAVKSIFGTLSATLGVVRAAMGTLKQSTDATNTSTAKASVLTQEYRASLQAALKEIGAATVATKGLANATNEAAAASVRAAAANKIPTFGKIVEGAKLATGALGGVGRAIAGLARLAANPLVFTAVLLAEPVYKGAQALGEYLAKTFSKASKDLQKTKDGIIEAADAEIARLDELLPKLREYSQVKELTAEQIRALSEADREAYKEQLQRQEELYQAELKRLLLEQQKAEVSDQSTEEITANLQKVYEQLDANRKQQELFNESLRRQNELVESGVSPAVAALVANFERLKANASTAKTALETTFEALKDAGDVSGIRATVQALDDLRKSGQITGEEFRQNLQRVLKEVADKDAGALEVSLTAAFSGSKASAGLLKESLDVLRTNTLKKLGIDSEEVATGMDKGFRDAAKAVDDLAQSANATSDEIAAALEVLAGSVSTVEELEKAVEIISELGKSGKISFEQMDEALKQVKDSISKLSDEDFAKLQKSAEDTLTSMKKEVQRLADAYSKARAEGDAALGNELGQKLADARVKLNNFKKIVDSLSEESFRRLGIDVEEVTTGIDKGFTKGVEAVNKMVEELDTLPGVIAKSIDKLVEQADTTQELEETQKSLDAALKAGKVSQEEYAKASEKISEKLQEIKDEASGVTDALKTLGLQSLDDLTKSAEEARDAFETLRENGTLGAGQLAEAFGKVAEAELAAAAAAGESQLAQTAAALRAEASTDAQREALDKVASKYGEVAEAATKAGDASEEAGFKATYAWQSSTHSAEEYRRILDEISARELSVANTREYNAAAEALRLQQLEEDWAEYQKQVEAAANEAQSAFQGSELWLRKLELALANGGGLETIRNLRDNFERLKGSVDDGLERLQTLDGLTLENLDEEMTRAANAASRIGGEFEAGFVQAVEAAREQLQAFRQEAIDFRDSIRDELFDTESEKAGLDILKAQTREHEIQQKLIEAKNRGDQVSVEAYQQALEFNQAIVKELEAQKALIDAIGSSLENAAEATRDRYFIESLREQGLEKEAEFYQLLLDKNDLLIQKAEAQIAGNQQAVDLIDEALGLLDEQIDKAGKLVDPVQRANLEKKAGNELDLEGLSIAVEKGKAAVDAKDAAKENLSIQEQQVIASEKLEESMTRVADLLQQLLDTSGQLPGVFERMVPPIERAANGLYRSLGSALSLKQELLNSTVPLDQIDNQIRQMTTGMDSYTDSTKKATDAQNELNDAAARAGGSTTGGGDPSISGYGT